jgi:hypothetical protein
LPERPGIVDVRDLAHRYMWRPRAIDSFLAATGLEVAPRRAWRGFRPPRVLVLVVPHHEYEAVESMRPWLGECDALVLVRHLDAPSDDPEVASTLEAEWERVREPFPATSVFDWRADDDAPCRAAIARAIELAARLDPRPPEPAPAAIVELPMSAWLPWSGPSYVTRPALVARQLVTRGGRALLFDADGHPVDLEAPRGPLRLAFNDAAVGLPCLGADHTHLCGVDATHPIAWRGHRMAMYWRWLGAKEDGFLSATDHDYPTGPAKKLWGYADNDPVSVALAPDGGACAQRFEHDVLVFDNVPVCWHAAGAVDVAPFFGDPRRATFYAQTEDPIGPSSDDPLDDDNRELAPVLALGDSPACRYALDLRHRVVRIRGPHEDPVAEPVGGPGEGFAVFDADHALVRRASGRLLGGWFRHATVEDGGMLWREDLSTGERALLGSAARAVCVDPEVEAIVQDAIREGRHDAAASLRARHAVQTIAGDVDAVPIPGTRNLLEIAEGFLRVV